MATSTKCQESNMFPETTIGELRNEFAEIQEQALDYFQREQLLAKKASEELDSQEAYWMLKSYWSHMTPQEQEIGEEIARRLVETMGKVAVAVRLSPLLAEVD